MSVFTFANGKILSNTMIDEIETMVLVRESDRLNELPSNYKVITGEMLGYSSSAEGNIDAQGYYHAGYPAAGGEAVAILQDDGTIAISFRGTNDGLDLTAVNFFPNNTYIYGFDEWLTSVAKFASKNGYTIDIVTGKSLGGACVNMLRDESNIIAGGAYKNATFFAVASPLIADNTNNLINYGYKNDYAHEWYEETLAPGAHNEASVTDNLVYYNNEYAKSNWNPYLDFSSHSYNAFSRGVDALQATVFADELTQDSFAILAETNKIKVATAISRVGTKATDAYVISVNDNSHIVYGAKTNDHIEMGSGADKIFSGKGDDIIYGGGGADRISAGKGNDQVFGGYSDDIIFGGNGNDTLYGDHLNDKLYGGKGSDTLFGGWGDDDFWGNKDADVFVFEAKGHDTVHDFQLGVDHLALDASLEGKTTIYALEASAQETASGDLLISYNKDKSMLLNDITLDDLNKYAADHGLAHWADAVFI